MSQHDEPTTAPPGALRLSADERARRIRALIHQARESADTQEQLRLYERAHRLDFNDAFAMSHHGMALATLRHQYQQGIVFCEEAVRRMGPHPDLLLNLARAYLASSNKREAVRALRRALAQERSHPQVLAELLKLGLRRRPVIPFLPRSFFLNKYLGMLRHRILTRGDKSDDGSKPIPAELGEFSAGAAQAARTLQPPAGPARG